MRDGLARAVQIVVLLVCLIALTACGNSSKNQQENKDSSNMVQPTEPETHPEPASSVPQKAQKGEFDVYTNESVSFCGLKFSVPPYFRLSNDSTETISYYYAESGNAIAMLMFGYQDIGQTLNISSQAEVENFLSGFMTGILSSFDSVESHNSENIEMAGNLGRRATFSFSVSQTSERNLSADGICYITINTESNKAICVLLAQSENALYDYSSDFEKIVSSASIDKSQLVISDDIPDNVRADFKELVDSYEKFFDEYIDFMNKFAATDNTAEMLSDYLDYMGRYAERMEALKNLDTDDMSPAEYMYYTEAMARISKRLLDVATK